MSRTAHCGAVRPGQHSTRVPRHARRGGRGVFMGCLGGSGVAHRSSNRRELPRMKPSRQTQRRGKMKEHARGRARVVLIAAVAALFALCLPATASADDPSGEPEPVPSIDPDWSANFVPPPPSRLRVAAACQPVDVVFYAQTDWLRLAQMMRDNPSACANYYVSIPPNTTDKTVLRPAQAPPIRALGPQFHAMAEIHFTGWSNWVAADSTRTWFDAGVEARRRMTVAGFDVNAGDIWAVNEFPSNVRTGTGPARQNARDFVRGLYKGDDSTPVRGLIWVNGIGQPTTFLDTYKTRLKL